MYGAFDVVLYFVIIQLFWLLINLFLILSYLLKETITIKNIFNTPYLALIDKSKVITIKQNNNNFISFLRETQCKDKLGRVKEGTK